MARRQSLILCLLLLYGVWLWRHTGAYASGSDQSGYLNFARLLSQGQLRCPQPLTQPPIADLSTLAAIPLGFRPLSDHQMAPTYPVGLPLLLATTSQLVGWKTGPHLVMWLHALAGVVLTWALARRLGLDRELAALAAFTLALSPQYVFNALHCMSDVPALVWTSAALLAACSNRFLTSGMCFAMAVLIRPTCALSALALLWVLARSPGRGQALTRLLLGGLPGALFLFASNRLAYGQAVTSGYGNVGPLFHLSYLAPTLFHYLLWLPVTVGPLVGLWLAWPLAFLRQRESAVLLLLWVTPTLATYALYRHTHEAWWYLRFLLPIFPPLMIGSLLIAAPWLARPRRKLGLAALTLVYACFWNVRLQASEIGSLELAYVQTARWARQHFEQDALVVSMQMSGCLAYNTTFAQLRWDTMQPQDWERALNFCEAQQRPLYAVLFPFEIDQNALKRCPRGSWTQVGRNFDITMWRWSPDRRAPENVAPSHSPN